jgi:hypothetical protein
VCGEWVVVGGARGMSVVWVLVNGGRWCMGKDILFKGSMLGYV